MNACFPRTQGFTCNRTWRGLHSQRQSRHKVVVKGLRSLGEVCGASIAKDSQEKYVVSFPTQRNTNKYMLRPTPIRPRRAQIQACEQQQLTPPATPPPPATLHHAPPPLLVVAASCCQAESSMNFSALPSDGRAPQPLPAFAEDQSRRPMGGPATSHQRAGKSNPAVIATARALPRYHTRFVCSNLCVSRVSHMVFPRIKMDILIVSPRKNDHLKSDMFRKNLVHKMVYACMNINDFELVDQVYVHFHTLNYDNSSIFFGHKHDSNHDKQL